MASAGSVPPDETQKNLIDKVAQYVAKNGTEFEEMMRKKQQGNGEYSFLSTTGTFYKYYQSKVRSEQIAFKVKFCNIIDVTLRNIYERKSIN